MNKGRSKNTLSKSEMLEKMPIPKLIRSLAWPAIVGFSVTTIYNMVDTAFITRISEDHSAASILALPIFIIVSAIGLAIGIGAGSTKVAFLMQQA